jgi:EAL domain-containing protein (putative c-di-GMP-specific phosphodiesterase class I)
MNESDGTAEIVRTIMQLAQNLGMDVVAEGVETESQRAQLRDFECELGQGYYFSEPINGEAAEALLLSCFPHAGAGIQDVPLAARLGRLSPDEMTARG